MIDDGNLWEEMKKLEKLLRIKQIVTEIFVSYPYFKENYALISIEQTLATNQFFRKL